VDDDLKPVMSEQDLFEFLARDEGLPVTRRAIKHAVLRREIIPTRIGNGNFFSKQDGWDWIKSRKQPGAYRLTNFATVIER
jgi:hypothetical protein